MYLQTKDREYLGGFRLFVRTLTPLSRAFLFFVLRRKWAMRGLEKYIRANCRSFFANRNILYTFGVKLKVIQMKDNKIIGSKIQHMRESKGLSIEEMAERSGLSVEQIERIEGNVDFPSLAPLIKIARVLGVRLGTFLDDQSQLGPVVCRKGDLTGDGIGFTNNNTEGRKHMGYYSMAEDKSGRHMEPFLIEVAPSAPGEAFTPSTHEGEEFIYVLQGSVEILYGKNSYQLSEGDSIYYDSIVSHHVHAAGNEPARILGVIYTPY